eukprot:sb/3468336/
MKSERDRWKKRERGGEGERWKKREREGERDSNDAKSAVRVFQIILLIFTFSRTSNSIGNNFEMACWTNNYPCIGGLRTYVIIVNIFNSLLGASFIVLGGLLLSQDDDCETDCTVTPGRLSISFFAVGLYILILGLSGIFGACLRLRNWGIVLHIWMAVFALLIHLVYGGGLIYAAEIDNLNTTISSNFSKVYSNYGDSIMNTIGIDIVQGTFSCCGGAGSSDYTTGEAATYWISNKSGYPCSCCSGFACDNSTAPTNLHSSTL